MKIELKNNIIIRLEDSTLMSIWESFLFWNRELKEISLPSLVSTWHWFLNCNERIKEISLPSLTSTW
jgi:hypothetical protein